MSSNKKDPSMVFVGDWLPKDRLANPMGGGDKIIVGNLECAFCDGEIVSRKAYTCILPTSCIDNVAKNGFSALSLANNHVYDAGTGAFLNMRKILEEKCQGVQFFGTRDKPYATLETDGRRVVVIGSLEPCRSRGVDIFREEDVGALIREIHGSFDAVYVYPHWGKDGEYTRWPSPRQQKMAKGWIEAGADGVFGSHSHVFQGHETYKGKAIYYSLGNFYFPHPENRLYEGTDVGLCVDVEDVKVRELFVRNGMLVEDESEAMCLSEVLETASVPLKDWTIWLWAKAIGSFNLRKNTASWRIRLRKNLMRTLPKYWAWQMLPKTLLFRLASLFSD